MKIGFYRLVRVLAFVVLGVGFLPKFEGRENMPLDGPCIVICNHRSILDPFILTMAFRRPIRYMSKKEIFSWPIIKHCAVWFGAFPVDRGGRDVGAIRTCMSELKSGGAVGIFPEGTRVNDVPLGPLHDGVALIALKGGRPPVLPVYVQTPYRLFRRLRVHIGKPVSLEQFAQARVDGDTIHAATGVLSGALLELR